jgi:hypothetical protein
MSRFAAGTVTLSNYDERITNISSFIPIKERQDISFNSHFFHYSLQALSLPMEETFRCYRDCEFRNTCFFILSLFLDMN